MHRSRGSAVFYNRASLAATAVMRGVRPHRCEVIPMSMIGNYRRVNEATLTAVCGNPDSISDFLYADDEEHSNDTYLDIDKAWHAIHFLLNDSQWEGSYPLVCVVLGGECIGDQDVGYGPARFLTPQQVKEVAVAINDIPTAKLLEKFDADRMNQEEIYPQGWSDSPEEREYIEQNYSSLVTFFRSAADAGDAMIVYLN